MKILVALTLVFSVANGLAIDIAGTLGGWLVPQLDGSMKWMAEKEWLEIQLNTSFHPQNDIEVLFKLYTRNNSESPQILITDDEECLRNSFFNPDIPTRFITHGWRSSADTDLCYYLRDAFLAINDHNVICVDWSDKADTIDYISSVLNVPCAGRKVAKMIDFLLEIGDMPLETLLLAGHSLGAHVSGFASKNTGNSRKVPQIVGLDPALPLYSYLNFMGRLNRFDADYVEIIHTNGGALGFLRAIGTADFYPNGGKIQPGCTDLGCSHSRSYKYYAEAILKNSFPATACKLLIEAIVKRCGLSYSSVRLGDSKNSVEANGVYYVQVNEDPPYGESETF